MGGGAEYCFDIAFSVARGAAESPTAPSYKDRVKPVALLPCAALLAPAVEPVLTPWAKVQEAVRALGPPELQRADAAFDGWLDWHGCVSASPRA
jgi:hypothetical protein